MVYLPTFTIKINYIHVDEYTIHGLFGYGVVACFSFAH